MCKVFRQEGWGAIIELQNVFFSLGITTITRDFKVKNFNPVTADTRREGNNHQAKDLRVSHQKTFFVILKLSAVIPFIPVKLRICFELQRLND